MNRVLCCFLAFFIGLSEQAALVKAVQTGEIIRLHVVAAGDSKEQQRVKICVRDAVLEAFGDKMREAKSAVEALAMVDENLFEIEVVAKDAACKEGYFGPVNAMTGRYPFPDREYEGVLVPQGDYQALRIVLGEGEGQNWWCILYPALCLATASSEPESEEIKIRWHLKDILKWWF